MLRLSKIIEMTYNLEWREYILVLATKHKKDACFLSYCFGANTALPFLGDTRLNQQARTQPLRSRVERARAGLDSL
jgi:hypothetical protein